MAKTLLTDKHVTFIQEGHETVDSNNVWNYEDTIETNLKDGVPQIFKLLPDLLPYLDTEKIQADIDPIDFGVALGQLLTKEQRQQVMIMLIWGEQQADESNQAFIARLPDLITHYQTDFKQTLDRMEHSGDRVKLLRLLDTNLQHALTTRIETKQSQHDIELPITIRDLITWAKTQQDPDTPPTIYDLLGELYAPWTDGINSKHKAVRDILLSLADQHTTDTLPHDSDTIETHWTLPPTDNYYDRYVDILDDLDPILKDFVDTYFDAEQIIKKDQIFQAALDELEKLDRPARDLLEWDSLTTTEAAWRGHHTRVANRWTTNRNPPLLQLETTDSDRREWHRTPMGELVTALYTSDIDRTNLTAQSLTTEIEDLLEQTLTEQSA